MLKILKVVILLLVIKVWFLLFLFSKGVIVGIIVFKLLGLLILGYFFW